MPAIKKSMPKSTKSPAPTTKSSRPPAKKSAAAPAPAAKTPAPPAPAIKPVAVAAAPLSAPAIQTVKSVATKPVATTVRACIDVGFGNTLYARGEGPGLNWDEGVLMECRSQDQWQLVLGESSRPFLVKFLVNDTTWSTGPDYTVPSGVSLTLAPQF